MRAATLTQSAPSGQPQWCTGDLEALFESCFGADFATRLEGGAEEPYYRAACARDNAVIFYTHDYFRSALHEVAHWCVAGPERRAQDDYGYWYAPDGRSAAEQREFERVETLPQAWELLFCAASGHPFRVSADNLGNEPGDLRGFEDAVLGQAKKLLTGTLATARGWRWAMTLAKHYRKASAWHDGWINDVFCRW